MAPPPKRWGRIKLIPLRSASQADNTSEKHADQVDVTAVVKIKLSATGKGVLVTHLIAFAEVATAITHTRRVWIVQSLLIEVSIVIVFISPSPVAGHLTFEKALEELEALVTRMEDGKLPLEESLAAYQRGAELIKYCESRLTDAQARIAILDGGELRDLGPEK